MSNSNVNSRKNDNQMRFNPAYLMNGGAAMRNFQFEQFLRMNGFNHHNAPFFVQPVLDPYNPYNHIPPQNQSRPQPIIRKKYPVQQTIVKQQSQPIYVDSESDSEDVQILDRPPPPHEKLLQIMKLDALKLPVKQVQVGKTVFDVPKAMTPELVKAMREALEIAPDINWAKASYTLTMFLKDEKLPKDIVNRIVIAGKDNNTVPSPGTYSDTELFLINSLNHIRMNTIRSCLNTTDIIKTYHELTENPPAEVVLMQHRKVKGPIRILDPYVSMCICYLSQEEVEKQKEKIEKLQKDQRFLMAQRSGETCECECCYEECLFEDMAQCPDGHLFCTKCLKKSIETILAEGRTEVKCLSMASGCEKEISIKELERVIDEKTLNRLFQMEVLNAITIADIPMLVKCCKCGFTVQFDGSGNFTCPQCHTETCTGCGLPAHDGMSCDVAKGIDKDRLAEEKLNDTLIRTCPRCKVQFMKEEGCNKMECPRCHTNVCYWCRQEIPKEIGYAHFWRDKGPCPPNKCPLWVNDEALQQVEEANARENNEVENVD